MTESLKHCTSGRRCEPQTLREALYCQSHHSVMRLDEIARRLGMSANSLADAVNPFGDGSILAAKHFERLIELTRDNIALARFISRECGAVVYVLPTVSISATTAKVIKEFGEMLTRHAEAVDDRAISRLEAAAIEKEAEEAIAAIMALVAEAKREAETGEQR